MAFRSYVASACVVVLINSSAAMAQESFRCLLTKLGSAGGWIPSEINVTHDHDKGKVVVSYALNGEPVSLMSRQWVETDNQRRTTFRWNAAAITASQSANMVYRLTIQKKGLSATVNATPEGYSNSFHASGLCAQVKD
ncbi:hypothetical protein MCELHM10_03251 [Paracoccaceae bacterium]|jgi:hypothetical protein